MARDAVSGTGGGCEGEVVGCEEGEEEGGGPAGAEDEDVDVVRGRG